MILRSIACLLAGLLSACAPRTPRETLEAYRDALRERDFETVWALSSSAARRAHGPPDLAAKADHPEVIGAASARIEACTSSVAREVFEVEIAGGRVVRLVREEGEWRVHRGVLDLASSDTPEHALDTFFRAIDAGDFALVRSAIPKRLVAEYTSDRALSAHLLHMEPRIARARARIGPLVPGRAEIEGIHAEIAYGEGRRATFEREDGIWRILDLE